MQKTRVIIGQAAPWLFWGIVIAAVAAAGAQSDRVGIDSSNPRSMTARQQPSTQRAGVADCRGQTMSR